MNRDINDIGSIHSIALIVKERSILGYKVFYISCKSTDINDLYDEVEDYFFNTLEIYLDFNISFEYLYERYKSNYHNIEHFKNKYHHLYSLCNDAKFMKSINSIFRSKKIDDILT